jgi:hypothetical protein
MVGTHRTTAAIDTGIDLPVSYFAMISVLRLSKNTEKRYEGEYPRQNPLETPKHDVRFLD